VTTPQRPAPPATDGGSASGSIAERIADAPSPAPAPTAAPAVVAEGMFGVAGSGDTSGFGGLVRRAHPTIGTERPFGGWFDEAYDALERALPQLGDAVEAVVVDRGELTVHVAKERLVEVLRVLRDDAALRFELLSCVSGVDYPEDGTGRRLHVVYHLCSLTYNRRLRLEVAAGDHTTGGDPHVPSAVGVYPTADWHERECWDFFGIIFDGHPGLTRIFMPDDWEGHPQRKDYPLGGIAVEYKGGHIPPPDERRSYA